MRFIARLVVNNCFLQQKFMYNHFSVVIRSNFTAFCVENNRILEQKNAISQLVSSNYEMSRTNWNSNIKNIWEISPNTLSESNIFHKILYYCTRFQNLQLGRNFVDFLINSNKKLDGALCCEFIKLCYKNRQTLMKNDLEKNSLCLDFLLKKYKFLDAYIGECVIKALLLQNQNDLIPCIVKQIEDNDGLNRDTYIALIINAIEKKQISMAKSYIEEMTKNYHFTSEICYSWIKAAVGDLNMVYELLNVFQITQYKPTKNVCNQIMKIGGFDNGIKLCGTYTTITDSGHCKTCGEQLAETRISEKEYISLNEIIMNKLLIGNEIYRNTMPYELEKFKKLMIQYGPFDLVIDGLNISYISKQTGRTSHYVKLVEKVFMQLTVNKLNVLFIGKWHMRKWPGLLDMLRRFDSRYLFVEDSSADDLYVICSTLHGKNKSFFLSNDSMTTEKLKLNLSENKLFEKWRTHHQKFLVYSHDELRIRQPITYEMATQKLINGCWHIPYRIHESNVNVNKIYKHWLCLK